MASLKCQSNIGAESMRDISISGQIQLQPPVEYGNYNGHLMSCGDFDGDSQDEVAICDVDGNIVIVKNSLVYRCQQQSSKFTDCCFCAMEAFPLLDENQAELILLDASGTLTILSCDYLRQEAPNGFAVMRQLINQDIELVNGSAMTAYRNAAKNVSFLICCNSVSMNFYELDPVLMALICIRSISEFKFLQSVAVSSNDYCICGDKTGFITVLKLNYRQLENDINRTAADISTDSISRNFSDRSSYCSDSLNNTSLRSYRELSTTPIPFDKGPFNHIGSGSVHIIAMKHRLEKDLLSGGSPWHTHDNTKATTTAVSHHSNEESSGDIQMPRMPSLDEQMPFPKRSDSFQTNDSWASDSQHGININLFTRSGYFAACWSDGTICICHIYVNNYDDSVHWNNVYTVKTNDLLYKLDYFGDFVNPIITAGSPWLSDPSVGSVNSQIPPKGTIVAMGQGGVCYIICLSTVWKQMWPLLFSGQRCNLIQSDIRRESSVTFGPLDDASSEIFTDKLSIGIPSRNVNPSSVLYRFDWKLLTGVAASRNFCCVLNATGHRNLKMLESGRSVEAVVTMDMDWQMYYISSYNAIFSINNINNFIQLRSSDI